ncbi:MAG: PilZ domain-containing protein [Sphingomicrobium sp.]
MATAALPVAHPRKDQRTRVLMRGTIFSPDGAAAVKIRDISQDGANVCGDDPLPADCDVIFKRGAIFVAAHIRWSDRTGAGLEFYRRLNDEELQSAHIPLPNRDD